RITLPNGTMTSGAAEADMPGSTAPSVISSTPKVIWCEQRGARRDAMAFTPAKWPGRVIPADKDQAEVATRSLFVRCQWRDPVTKEAKAILQRWYDAWWCVDALVVGLERKPGKSGERQPRRGDKESVEKFLRSRLREWFDDEAD